MVLALVGVAALGWVVARDRMVGYGHGARDGAWIAGLLRLHLGRNDGGDDAPVGGADGGRTPRRSERRRRDLGRDAQRGGSAAFVGGYLLVWTAFGIVAYALFELVRSLDVDALAWSRGGRYVAALVVAAAAVYQLTPLKDVCLAKCRSPLAFVVGSWRAGRLGAARMGIEHGAWCVGCCWALMATLFALGVMSIVWMVVIAALVALEKLSPWEGASRGVALLLLALAASHRPRSGTHTEG